MDGTTSGVYLPRSTYQGLLTKIYLPRFTYKVYLLRSTKMDSWIHLLTKESQHTVFRVCLQIRQRAFISYYHVNPVFKTVI